MHKIFNKIELWQEIYRFLRINQTYEISFGIIIDNYLIRFNFIKKY